MGNCPLEALWSWWVINGLYFYPAGNTLYKAVHHFRSVVIDAGSRGTTAHLHQCCRFQSYEKTVPSRMKLTMHEPASMTTDSGSQRVTSYSNSVLSLVGSCPRTHIYKGTVIWDIFTPSPPQPHIFSNIMCSCEDCHLTSWRLWTPKGIILFMSYMYQVCTCTWTCWRLVPSIIVLGSVGNACYSKIKSSSMG